MKIPFKKNTPAPAVQPSMAYETFVAEAQASINELAQRFAGLKPLIDRAGQIISERVALAVERAGLLAPDSTWNDVRKATGDVQGFLAPVREIVTQIEKIADVMAATEKEV